MFYLIQLIIDNINLSDNLDFRFLNKETKHFFDNNIFWLKRIEDITVDYKYFIKRDEEIAGSNLSKKEISYFNLYKRINDKILRNLQDKIRTITRFIRCSKKVSFSIDDIQKIIKYEFVDEKLIFIFITKEKKIRSFVVKNICADYWMHEIIFKEISSIYV